MMQPMRVLYVADSLMAGGIEAQLVALVTGFDPARIAPYVLSLYGPHARDLHYAPQLRAAGVPLVLPDLGWTAREKARGIAAIVRTARAVRPHIIQAEGYHANLLTRLAWPLLPRSARLVGTLRGIHSAKQMRYERLSAWMCARIVTNADHLRGDLVRRGRVAEEKIACIPNGIEVARFAQPYDPQLRAHIAPDARIVFVSLGRISREKNMHWLAEAFGLLKRRGELPAGIRLFIVGPPHHDDAQELLEAAIARDGLEDVVVQHPATLHPEDYYAAADAVMLFSPSEGMPNVPLEAMAAGKPVIISASANATGIVEDGVTGWVVPTGNIAALAQTLRQAITQAAPDGAAMAIACRECASRYSIAALVARYVALYTDLTCSEPSGPIGR